MKTKDLMITGITRKTAKNGNDFLTISLVKQEDKERIYLWNNLDRFEAKYQAGDIVKMTADFEEQYSNLKKCDKVEGAKQGDYVKYEFETLDKGYKELSKIVKRVQDSRLRNLLETIFSERDIVDKFILCVGGLKNHHTNRGGLLLHTIEVFNFTEIIARSYPNVDEQIALAGAILHDIGKIYEYKVDMIKEPQMDFTSHSTTHLCKGAELVDRFGRDILEKQELEHLKHIINSHHLITEWGAITTPKTLEAIIVAYADNFSTQRNRIEMCDFENGIGTSAEFRGTYLDFKQRGGE